MEERVSRIRAAIFNLNRPQKSGVLYDHKKAHRTAPEVVRNPFVIQFPSTI